MSELLHLPDKVYPVFGMTVGVPDEEHGVKPRLPVAQFFMKMDMMNKNMMNY